MLYEVITVRFAAAIAEFMQELEILIKNENRRLQSIRHVNIALVVGDDPPHNVKPSGSASRLAECGQLAVR